LNSGERVVLVRKEVFPDIFRRLGELFSSGGGAVVFEQGKASGESDARGLVAIFGKEAAKLRTPELSMLYLSLGWGRPELVEFTPDPFSAVIRIYESFECSDQKSSTPYSQFVRGHLAGLVNGLFDKLVDCEERKCMAQGDSWCEFSLSELRPR